MVERSHKEKKDPLPRKIQPMLSIAQRKIPTRPNEFISELSFGGLRTIAYVDNFSGITILTRDNDNVAENFSEISNSLKKLSKKHSVVLDGQLVCINDHRSKDGAKQKARQTPLQQKLNPIGPCYFIINDILYIDGKNLISQPLVQRKKQLTNLFPEKRKGLLVINPYSETDHKNIRRLAKALGIKEVSYRKKQGSYKPGIRSKEWVRVKVR